MVALIGSEGEKTNLQFAYKTLKFRKNVII